MRITDFLENNILFLDGALGTELQKRGLMPGELPERWAITHPDDIKEIHLAYFNAGSNVVSANTFGANTLKFSEDELDRLVGAAISLARAAAKESPAKQEKWVALDIGPTGRMLKPYGDLDFEAAVSIFKKTVRLGVKHGADLIFIETMNDCYETKAALLAAKEECDLPVFVCNAYSSDGKLVTGATPSAMVAMLEGLGADALGVNCSLGPQALSATVKEYLKYASVPVILKPNAGLPVLKDGSVCYDVSEADFAKEVSALVKEGTRIVGGCCGTTPKYIEALCGSLKDTAPLSIEKKNYTVVSSYANAVVFGNSPILIGERINPTGKPKFKEALRSRDLGYIVSEGICEEERGVHILDVNVGLPEIDECEMLTSTVSALQSVTALPLQLDSSDFSAMEAALRIYNGKAMINSVSAKPESMRAIFPLVKKYGGVVVALTLDEHGIPETAEGRLDIAKRILAKAAKYGIEKKDIIFDPLALTVSADSNAGRETLRAVRLIKEELGVRTSLGVSNVSFGLPKREVLNASFLTLALAFQLDAAIINPNSLEMMKAYHSYLALMGLDVSCDGYIEFCESFSTDDVSVNKKSTSNDADGKISDLCRAITKGVKEAAERFAKEELSTTPPLEIIKKKIIPALNEVGRDFERGRTFLPKLLMSAEAAKAAFEVIKSRFPKENAGKSKIVIATVKGDIHDIGKNIVKLLLENYGFSVIDLGRDVPPEKICKAVKDTGAELVALSALMTTTVPAMEETIKLLRAEAPAAKVIVGGAVLTAEYAEKIGADAYAEDAMGAVRWAESLTK